jgi:hypothetical protein
MKLLLFMNHNDTVSFVKRQFLQQIPVRHFQWPENFASIQSQLWENVPSLIELTQVFSPGLNKYPPGDRYRYLLLRDLVTKLENEVVPTGTLRRKLMNVSS